MILAIGAGIGGLTAAIALRQAGVDVEVFERAPELHEVGAGLALWKNAVAALEVLGVAGAIRKFSLPQSGAGLRTWDGRVLVAPSPALAARLGEIGLVMPRARLQAALADAAGRGTIRLGKACTSIEPDSGGVIARFADGTSVRGTGLVGADGLHSVVRAHLHGARPPTYSGYTSWRAILPFDHASVRAGESWGYGARFGQVPMAGGDVYWFATRNAPPGVRAAAGEKNELRRLFRGWHAPIESLIEATPEAAILRVDIHDRPPLSRWGAGRVTLLGDAAHPMTPNLGQGACQAIEDAVALGRSLRDSASDVSAAFRVYEASRIARANRIVKASRRVGTLAQWEMPLAVSLRSLIFKHIGSRMQARQLERLIEPGLSALGMR
jgi:2-polyprenyl-6-methoxyphenol hydroxylase-like FAD-dependent oxidoreductase